MKRTIVFMSAMLIALAAGSHASSQTTQEGLATPGGNAAAQPAASDVLSAGNPEAATTAPSCGNISVGNLGSLNGFVPYSSSSLWNTNIASAAVDPKSATIINALNNSPLHPDFTTPADGGYGIPYTVVDSTQTPTVYVNMDQYPDQSDFTRYPIPSTAPIEGAPGNCSNNGDNHLIVIDRAQCWVYELGGAQLCNGKWSAGAGAVWDMTTAERRPYGWTSTDAGGDSVFGGLLRYDEVAAGAVNHAIRITVNNTLTDSNDGYFVAPATHAAGNSTSTSNIMGMRLRLKASFDISGFSKSNQVILKAMQQYGLIVADNGSNMYFQGTPDPRWNDDDLGNLKSIGASNFEVVKMGTVYDAGTAPTGAPPTISSFTTSSPTYTAGGTVTLSWAVSNSSYNYIHNVGTVRGTSRTVRPSGTTTYVLTATNQYGRTTKSVTVTLN